MADNRPKIGLAMSGAAARSVFYIGFLESLVEQDVPIDMIGASSGASVVAACFAVGKLDQLKKEVFAMDRKFIMSFMNRGKDGGGWYSLDAFEEYVRDNYTHGKTMEAVYPKLCFIASDLEAGEQVTIAMGDIARAMRISCTVPGAFEPVKWGNRTLVDGGLLTYIPGSVVRESGVDVVIGVHVQATKHIFLKNHMIARGVYNYFKKYLGIQYVENLFKKVSILKEPASFLDYVENLQIVEEGGMGNKGLFGILGRSLDLAIEASKNQQKNTDDKHGCDLIISAAIGNFYSSFNISSTKHLYEEGRKSGTKYSKVIKQMILEKSNT